jgi:hypothetical protein
MDRAIIYASLLRLNVEDSALLATQRRHQRANGLGAHFLCFSVPTLRTSGASHVQLGDFLTILLGPSGVGKTCYAQWLVGVCAIGCFFLGKEIGAAFRDTARRSEITDQLGRDGAVLADLVLDLLKTAAGAPSCDDADLRAALDGARRKSVTVIIDELFGDDDPEVPARIVRCRSAAATRITAALIRPCNFVAAGTGSVALRANICSQPSLFQVTTLSSNNGMIDAMIAHAKERTASTVPREAVQMRRLVEQLTACKDYTIAAVLMTNPRVAVIVRDLLMRYNADLAGTRTGADPHNYLRYVITTAAAKYKSQSGIAELTESVASDYFRDALRLSMLPMNSSPSAVTVSTNDNRPLASVISGTNMRPWISVK